MDVQQIVEDYIVEDILFGDGEKLRAAGSFRENRVLDSLGFLSVVTFMEQRFDIKIADEEVVPGNFDTLAKMSEFVKRKINERTRVPDTV